MGEKTPGDLLEPVGLPSYGASKAYPIRLPLYVYEAFIRLPSYHRRAILKFMKAILYLYALNPDKIGRQITEILKGNIDVDKLKVNMCEAEHQQITILHDRIKEYQKTVSECYKVMKDLKKLEREHREIRKLHETLLAEIKKTLEDPEARNKALILHSRLAKLLNENVKAYKKLVGEGEN